MAEIARPPEASRRVAALRQIRPALLENWMRHFYYGARLDLGSSGVKPYSLREVEELTELCHDDLASVLLEDGHSLGTPALRRAIADRWCGGDDSRVMATHGSSEGIFLVMTALLTAGDEVVVLDPCYQQLAATAEAIGCRVKRWPLRFERRWRPDLSELRRLVTSQTRMVVVNFPHNPTGASISLQEREELLRMVSRVGAYLVWDAAFVDLTYEGAPLPDPTLTYERALSLGTLSKAYGLPGLRVGWCLAQPQLLGEMVRLRDYVTLHISPLVEVVAARAIAAGDRLIAPRREQALANLERLERWVAENREDVEWVQPAGGVTAFPRFRHIADADEFCRELARAYGILLVPGTCFGRPHPQHVRLGFGGAADRFEEGLGLLARALTERRS